MEGSDEAFPNIRMHVVDSQLDSPFVGIKMRVVEKDVDFVEQEKQSLQARKDKMEIAPASCSLDEIVRI
jgi:hypothetical protein